MSTHNIGLSKHSILPPIVPDSDKKFLDSIQGYIITEIEKVGCTEQGPAEEYYIIYSNVFDKIIEHVTVYKNILTSIKQEYDAFIEAIKKGQRNAFYLHGKLKVLASEATTLIYYRKRAIQLEDKIKVIERNSSRIQNLILKIRNIKKVPSTEALAPRKKINPAKPIPGLTVKESLGLDALSRHLAQLEERVQELKADMISKYIPLENKAGLEQELKHSLELRDKAEAMNEKLRLRYKCSSYNIPCFYVGDILYNVLISHIFERDPSKSKEAEDLLEYIERFNELFSYGQYEAAAVYAANCPRGILRNEETMMKFKALGAVKGRILPLLRYFEALISSSAAVRHPLCAAMTLEAIKCALSEKQLNLVMHWVTHQRLTFCEAAGDVIYDYGEVEPFNKSKCLALAQIAYSQCGVHKKAALCLCKRGQICGAMDYIQQFKQLTLDDYLFLLKNCPSIELIHCLTQEWNEKPALLSIGATILSLIDTDHKEHGLQLLEEINMDTYSWKKIADTCAENSMKNCLKKSSSILTSQEGVVRFFIG
uniref:Clathrin heavy chain linker domain-containing protein 1 n=1 Tax=Chelonoidis abingdonii TaxID=106734 RepID=A0A8C0H423_CHEAB